MDSSPKATVCLLFLGVPCKRKIPESAKKWTEVQKRTWLHEEIAAFLDLFLFAENKQTISELHGGMSYMEHGRLHGYTCRVDGCNEVFMLHPMRVKYGNLVYTNK